VRANVKRAFVDLRLVFFEVEPLLVGFQLIPFAVFEPGGATLLNMGGFADFLVDSPVGFAVVATGNGKRVFLPLLGDLLLVRSPLLSLNDFCFSLAGGKSLLLLDIV